ncbi:virulence associated lipoprotein (plasmid) [Borrelia recurrentis]|uniref:virulence associated lipoprotein n=1 Tax=Borrelia recurrentis TaxID=44449 RepID=UPI003670FD03
MKHKNFILFIAFIFVLISVLLVSCGPKKKYAPVASVMRQRRVDMPFKKPSFGVTPRGLTGSADGEDPVDGEEFDDDEEFDSYLYDPDDETSEERMQKEKETEEIKGKIPVEVKEILRKHSLAGTNVGNQLIIPEFNGHFLGQKELEQDWYNLGVLSALFWGLVIDESVKDEYLARDNFELQKKFYLALEYNDDLLKPFAYVYGRLSYDVSKRSYYDEQTIEKILAVKSNIVYMLRYYAVAYYIDVYQYLLAKKDKLNDELSLKGVRFLKSKLNEIELAKQKLRTNIIQKFVDDCKKYEPYSIDSKHDVWPHLRDTFNDDFQTKCNSVIMISKKIKDILKNIL